MPAPKIVHEPTVTPESFAEFMSRPWTCYGCGRTFHPTPDDPNSHSIGIQYEDVRQENGDYLRRTVGELCHDCMTK